MARNPGRTGPERSGDAAAPLRRVPLYAQAEKVLEDLLVHRQYRIGDRIPPEAELVRSLGVSRATISAFAVTQRNTTRSRAERSASRRRGRSF